MPSWYNQSSRINAAVSAAGWSSQGCYGGSRRCWPGPARQFSWVTGSAAASTGSAYYSADQAGYVATGAKFKFAGGTVRLPDASHYARELGRVGVSIQLWDTRRPRRPRHCHRQYA